MKIFTWREKEIISLILSKDFHCEFRANRILTAIKRRSFIRFYKNRENQIKFLSDLK
jgi:hypothetical protein